MKLLFSVVMVALAVVTFGDGALAQKCGSACAREHARCQTHFAELGSACRRRCGQSESCNAACQKREDAYAAECDRHNRACTRACGR